MKKLTLIFVAATFLASCSQKLSNLSKNSAPFPGMTVSRSDYKLSKDVTAEVEVNEWTLGGCVTQGKGCVSNATAVGEQKKELRQGIISGYSMDKASQIAVYRLLDANPSFDYLTNIRVQKTFDKKDFLIFSKSKTKVKVTAKGITLNTEK